MYDVATYDAKRPAPGTQALWDGIRTIWPASRFLGIYAARSVRGSDSLSLHAEGRAVDLVPPDGQRDTVAAWAKAHATALGIQEVIVYETRKIWTTARDAEGWRPYKGVAAGLHHIHIGQHRAGAGIAGGQYDASVIKRTIADLAQEQGFAWWHAGIAAALGGGLLYYGHRLRRTGKHLADHGRGMADHGPQVIDHGQDRSQYRQHRTRQTIGGERVRS